MIELLFVTCLAAAPEECRDRSLLYTADVGVMTCLMQGQAELAKWIDTHPGETVTRWKCRQVDTREVKA
jgi:hypothetical protein